MGVHDLKQALMAEHAGVTGLIMQYEPGGDVGKAQVDAVNESIRAGAAATASKRMAVGATGEPSWCMNRRSNVRFGRP